MQGYLWWLFTNNHRRKNMHYKGHYVWYNELQGWMVQLGYEVCGVYKTLPAAKSAITQYKYT